MSVSGDDDRIRLRILAEKHAYRVGDTAKVQLHWREDPALALVTFEGARVLGYRLVELKKGSNTLTLPMDAKLAPNFVLSVAVMEKNKLHQAQSEFLVARKLTIKLKTNGKTLKPGDEVSVEVTTTDPQGRPVSAEVSLGLIQQNLLDLFPAHQGEIAAYFGGGYRKPSVRAFTSATFRYRPTTRGISKYLLAEQERRSILIKELDLRKKLAEVEQKQLDQVRVMEQLAQQEAQRRLLTGPFENAEGVARQAANLAPGYMPPGTSRFGTIAGLASPDAFAGDLDRTWETLNEVERSAIPYDGNANSQESHRRLKQMLPPKYARAILAYTKRIADRQQNGQGQGGAGGFNDQPNAGDNKALFDSRRKWASVNLQGQSAATGGEDFSKLQSSIEKHTAGQWRNIEGVGGNISNLETTLSLIIRQNQRVHDQLQPLLKGFSALNDGTVVALIDNGEYQVVNGIEVAKLNKLTRIGMRVLPGMSASETGYWNPVVVTDKTGKAVVKFRLPNRSTAWRLQAAGTDAGVLSGAASTELITKKDLFGQIKTPLAFYTGDKANVLVEVHNAKLKKGTKIAVELQTTIGNRTTKLSKTITSTGPGIAEVSFPVQITAGESADFKLSVKAGKDGDESTASVPVRPFGLPVFATASGSAAQSTIVFVQHDKRLAVQDQNLEIVIGPSINRTLLDAVLGGGTTRCERSFVLPGSGIERNISDVIGGVALLKMIRASRNADSPEGHAIAGRIQSALVALISSQRGDGGWSWSGRPGSGGSDRFLSSRAVWALADARRSGFAVPETTFNNAKQFLKSQYTAAATSDREGRAILLHGMAASGCADFAFANRLYRERNSLSASALLHVALALVHLDRKQMAADLLSLVKLPTDRKTARAQGIADLKGVPYWMRSGVELRALYLLALNAAKPGDAKAGPLAEWLLAARRGSRWYPEKANGPAIAALADWLARSKFAAEKYTLEVVVNGGLVEKFTLDPSKDGSRRVVVPAKLLRKEKGKQQQINLNVVGRGRFSYSAVLGGFVAADKLKSTTNDFRVTRKYQPAHRMLDGKQIPRGFGILTGSYKTFTNPLTQLPLGDRGEVSLAIRRPNDAAKREYLVVTEPIPAGCSVLANSIRGSFQRYEITPGAITFFIGTGGYSQDISYTLVGYLPGQSRAVPTVVRSFYSPSRIAVGTIKTLDTLARGQKSKDKYKLTPVELYEFGKRYLAKRDYKTADKHLLSLFRSYRLRAGEYQDVVRKLFRTSLELNRNPTIVEFFEIIKEKYPSVEINFDDILRVAHAYRELGEYERGYLVYRATIEAAFQRESQIAGFLDDRNEFRRSVQIVEDLIANYPAESYVATGMYSLAQEVFGKAGEILTNKKLRDAGLTKAALIAANIRVLDHFMSTWPKDPAVDQAAFAMANSYLELENYSGAIRRCEKFSSRYPKSKLLDSFWYVIGYSQFAMGKHQDALKMVKQVADTKRKDPATGVEVAAANKWQAVYIMGQIYHSLGKPKEAIAEYKRVQKRFPDALQSIDFFTRKEITLPEVTTVKPGVAVKTGLKFRNIASANVKVYRIDLLKFGLMQRNLNRITAINLAGIRPYHEMTLKLGDGHDFRDRKRDLQLPLKEEGAYLVVCRGESLYASGLVLVSPLTLQIQENAASGRVRVTVRDATADKYAKDVEVKVIGSSNKDFTSGKSDLRGIFIADAIRGTSTVIAKADKNRYAFYRGKAVLGNVPKPSKSPAPQKPSQGKGGMGKGDLLKNLRRQNFRGSTTRNDNSTRRCCGTRRRASNPVRRSDRDSAVAGDRDIVDCHWIGTRQTPADVRI